MKDREREHVKSTLKNTFLKRSTFNLSSLVNQLELYRRVKYTTINNCYGIRIFVVLSLYF